jgi:amidase
MDRRRFIKAGAIAGGLAISLGLPEKLQGKSHEIYTDTYSDVFSAAREPILRINSGDTVRTRTLDAAGRDYKGVPHAPDPFGNPGLSNAVTGPFYIEGASFGDSLQIHLDKVRLNRNWGYTNYRLMPNSLNPNTLEHLYKDYYKPDAVWPGRANLIPWDLDIERGVANPRLLHRSGMRFNLPVRPMLGCIGVAAPADNSGTADISGSWGGNMDYNDVVEDATLYFPVYHTGAYFYLGDGHARQGDGEGLGMGIETSMDVEFTATVLKGKELTIPRLANEQYIVSIASQAEWNSNLDLGIQAANSDMIRWLMREYKLTQPEAHLLIGMVIQYKVVTYFGSVAGMIPKRYLPSRQLS